MSQSSSQQNDIMGMLRSEQRGIMEKSKDVKAFQSCQHPLVQERKNFCAQSPHFIFKLDRMAMDRRFGEVEMCMGTKYFLLKGFMHLSNYLIKSKLWM